jgi:hypothetical protein
MECKAFNCVNSLESSIKLADLPKYLRSVTHSVSVSWADHEIVDDAVEVLCDRRGIVVTWSANDHEAPYQCARIWPMYPSQETVEALHSFAVSTVGAEPMKGET